MPYAHSSLYHHGIANNNKKPFKSENKTKSGKSEAFDYKEGAGKKKEPGSFLGETRIDRAKKILSLVINCYHD